MNMHHARGLKPTVSIAQGRCDKPRHTCKSSLSVGVAGATNPAKDSTRALESPDVQPQAGRTLGAIETHGKRCLATVAALMALALPASAESHVKGCHSRKCDRRISAKRHRLFWVHRFQEKSPWERTWARCISFHESGNRPVARASGHWGYFQWSLPTWHAAGGSGNPETHSWTEQAVRAIRWAHIAGSSQWSTSVYCGGV